jgi:hypothetical protein
MLDNPIRLMEEYLDQDLAYHMKLIRGDHPEYFTRKSIISAKDILQQMLNRKNLTQDAELKAYYSSMNIDKPPVTDKGFFTARKKFNPEAVHVMSNEYIARIYDNYDDSIDKWKGYVVLGIDGSKYIVPNTEENRIVFGVTSGLTENQPAMALVSTLHDSLNNLKLDVQIDRIDGNEKELAAKHIDQYCDNYHQPGLFVFDRGYVSIRLIDQIISRKQHFLIRARSTAYKKYFDQVSVGEDKELDVTFDRASTNDYRNDTKFRIHLLNTVYKIRFAKVVIGIDDTGNDIVELLMTNLPKEEVSTDELKECYWLRWGTETSYNRLKNRMSTEEFSGYKPILIKQDIYADAWLFNLVSLKIKEADQKKPAEQKKGSYTVSRNFNKVLGTLKSSLLKALTTQDKQERSRLMALIDENINSALCWVKNGERNFERKTAVNKSKMSYRRTY